MLKNIKKYATFAILAIFVFSAMTPMALGAAANQTYYGSLSSNYYSFYGQPDIHVSVQGNGEYSRGQTATVPLTLSNHGVIEGFKSENEVKDRGSNVDQQLNATLQQMELENINSILTAVGVVATLESDVSGITVKTGTQEAGSLTSGSTTNPLNYYVDIQKDVPAGEYELTLNVTFKHLRNVIYDADAISNGVSLSGIRNLNASYWYNEDVSQKIPVTIKVKEATKFEIVNVDHSLSAKNDGMLYVTYKNNGEEQAKSAFVRLSTATPFSTTDDQSYLGTVKPGDEVTAAFKISVDEDSVIFDKLYAINSEILYEDNYGHQQITDALKVEVQVEETPFWTPATIAIALIVVLILIAAGYYLTMSQKYKKEGLDKKPFDGIRNKISGGKKE
ncbi:hypothetical protein MmiEs2_00920 [Methanimicrococcus stummii]|uniref:S-layer protein n=1 Tax=Methanimicrococcus stummii TaxID=3028294 RepID=A0AA96V817_9EURY|nr:hypothetical protein [Methanimicrococcus sp. Es2]WNY27913.1 hypothetical protein MmiEs2_00920 [Methanimicrococcus sp. Es2]